MKQELAKLFGISEHQIKIFFLAFLGMFIITTLHYLGVRSPWTPPRLTIPVPAQSTDIMDTTIKPKLEEKPNSFSLREKTPIVPQTYAAEDIDLLPAYAVVDLDTGEIIKSKNSKTQLPIASITKVMTAVVALDLADPSDVITVDEKAAAMVPTKINIIPGEQMTLDELLHAAILSSANDATEQIKNGIDKQYGEEVFIKAMNAKAELLGLTNTHFTNAMGFDHPEHYSSAEDLAILAHYALTNYPEIAAMAEKDFVHLTATPTHQPHNLYNWNGLIGVYPDVHGIKIGNTGRAGRTTLVYATRGGKKIAAIVLGAPGTLERDLWAARLLDIGYEQTIGLPPVNITEEQLLAKYSTWQY